MTKLTKEEIRHIARLAQLELSPKELEKLRKQLVEILDYAKKLNELNTSKIEPTSQVTGLENVFREDKPAPSLSQKEVLSNAPERRHDYFKAKGVFEP